MVVIVCICLVLLAYTYVGYPLLIAALARLFPHKSAPTADYQPLVTACIPAYNVAGYLDSKIASLLAQDYPAEKLQILVYSDGSTDETDDIAQRWAERDARVQFIRAELRAGKPTALNVMKSHAQGELLLLTDSRQRLDPSAVRHLVHAMSDPRVGCATGNLVLEGSAGSGMYWRYESWIRMQESKFRSVIGMTGPIAMLRRADLAAVPASVILDDVLIPMRLRLRGQRVVLVEEARAFDAAFGDEREFGRKARTLAGNYQLFSWMPELLLPWKNPSWLETMSHKVLRLVCPWLLIALFATSLTMVWLRAGNDWLAQANWILLGAQVLLYGAALLGTSAGRVGAFARTFVVLNFAAQVGLWRFVTKRQAVTW